MLEHRPVAGFVGHRLPVHGVGAAQLGEDLVDRPVDVEGRVVEVARRSRAHAHLRRGTVSLAYHGPRRDRELDRGSPDWKATRMSDDLEEIRKLKARYFRLMDTKQDGDKLEGLFTEDLDVDMTGEGGAAHRAVRPRVRGVRCVRRSGRSSPCTTATCRRSSHLARHGSRHLGHGGPPLVAGGQPDPTPGPVTATTTADLRPHRRPLADRLAAPHAPPPGVRVRRLRRQNRAAVRRTSVAMVRPMHDAVTVHMRPHPRARSGSWSPT